NCRVVLRLQQGDRGEYRDGRLAYRHDVDVPAEKPEKLKDVVDIVVEVEGAFSAWHEASILPLGDVDVVMRQEVTDGTADQWREVAGHWRHDQELGVPVAAPGRNVPLEMNEVTERLRNDDVLPHSDLSAPDLRRPDPPQRLGVASRSPLE